MATRFVDARGTEWEVWEVGARRPLADGPPSVRRARAGEPADERWLRFESATQRRRLAAYPAHWEALGPGELAELCSAARPDTPTPTRRFVFHMDVADA